MKTLNNKKIEFVTNFALEQLNKYNLNSWKIKFLTKPSKSLITSM